MRYFISITARRNAFCCSGRMWQNGRLPPVAMIWMFEHRIEESAVYLENAYHAKKVEKYFLQFATPIRESEITKQHALEQLLFFSLSRIMFCIVIAEAGETDSYQQFKSKACRIL